MKKIIQLAVIEKKVTLLMAVILMISGIICFYIIPRQENPDTSAPVAMLTTVYPGAAPEDVERLVTNKVEDEAYALEGR
jgi:multidrug efflux pump subunit AcrB